jgi:uncharacterized protein with GYD domain
VRWAHDITVQCVAWGMGGSMGGSMACTVQRQVQSMPRYVTLVKFTDQGARNAKDTVTRAGAFRSDVERRGGKLVSIYWTQGQYDIVVTLDTPDEQAAMAATLAVAGLGNVRTETLRAFDETEMGSIIQKI